MRRFVPELTEWINICTLEQIAVTKRLVEEYPNDLQFCETAACLLKGERLRALWGLR